MLKKLDTKQREIHLDAPNVDGLEKEYLNRAIDDGYVSTAGPYVSEFEEKVRSYLGAKKAVSTQSGTAALLMALYELGIGSQDEVIVPVLTFVATANAVVHVGAKPVFVDVDSATWNIDPEKMEKAITKKTKAIIPVHLYGNPCQMDIIMDIAKRHNLYVIEDAAESLGAKYRRKNMGTFGDYGCFSFNGNKIVTTGGGGMVVGEDARGLEHIKFLANQARSKSNRYYYSEVGFNYRMTNIEAALGLAQMEKIDKFLNKKRVFNHIYRSELGNIDNIHFQEEFQDAESSYWFTCIAFDRGIEIGNLQIALKRKGVPTRRIFMPVVEFIPYKIYKKDEYKNAYSIYAGGLCLPSSTRNTKDDIYCVCKTIEEVATKASKDFRYVN